VGAKGIQKEQALIAMGVMLTLMIGDLKSFMKLFATVFDAYRLLSFP
jgi:hypothetical protein